MGGIAGAGAAIGTGAFDQINADRTVSVNVEGDADAYLGLEPINSAYATTDGDDVLELTFDEDGGAGGDGFNPNSTTHINEVFSISNQGTQDVGVSVEKGDLAEGVDKFDFLAQTDTDEESLVYESPVVLESGESFDVGVEAEISSSDTIDGVIEDDEIVITADIDDEDGADELQPVQNVDQGESYDSISAAVGEAGDDDTIQVASGTYPESVTISVDGLTLEGPNAGIHGDSDERGAEARITDGVFFDEQDGVTVDGFELERTVEDGNGVVQLGTGDPARIGENAVVENNVINAVPGDGSGRHAGVLFEGDLVDDLTVQSNLITQEEGTDLGEAVQAVSHFESEIGQLNVTDNTIDTESAISLGGASSDITAEISENEFTDSFESLPAVDIVESDEIDVDIDDNTFNGPVAGVRTSQFESEEREIADPSVSVSVTNNEFIADETVWYVEDNLESLTLSDVLTDQDNIFDPEGEVNDNQIVPQSEEEG